MKKIKKVLAVVLSLAMLVSITPQVVFANSNTTDRYVEVDGTQAIVEDAEVHVYVTQNGGTATLTDSNGLEETFTQGIGYREYTATPENGWIWKGWTYEQLFQGEDLGNRTDVGWGIRYSFTNDGQSGFNFGKSPYDGVGRTISVNRLLTTGETLGNKITYNIYANFNPTITATAGTGGTITEEGVKEVEYGGNKTYEITADTGKYIDSVTVDGQAIPEATGQDKYSYSFEDVTAPHKIEVTFTDKLTVTYTDGVEEEEIFKDEIYSDLKYGDATPKFDGSLERTGYVFTGWTPEVSTTVTQNVTYTAQWAVDENGDGKPDNDEKYTVSYKFINKADDKKLPQKIKGMLPKEEEHLYGLTVSPAALEANRVETKNGVWLFEGWKPEKIEKLTKDTVFKGAWNYYPYQEVEANDLTVYEGGLGSNGSTDTGNALPEPAWNEQMSGHTITVDGTKWDIEKNGLPFTWKYLDENNNEVMSSAMAGTYSLNVYPKQELDGKDVLVDNQFALKLPADGLKVSTVNVRDITDNEDADSLSTETFKNVYNYTSPQASAISMFALDNGESALDGEFDIATGTHNDDCNINEPHAHVKEGTTFLKNGKADMPVGEGAKIGLLWDNLLANVLGSDERMATLHEKSLNAINNGTFNTDGTINKEFKYIDLVDMTDGNVWVGTAKNDVTIYYPYPEGVTKDSAIAVTYYDGLTRDYTVDMGSADLDNEIDKSNAHPVNNLRKTDTGILFDVPSKQFGPIEVMWQKSYTPTYEFISGTDGKELPQEVKDLLADIETKSYAEGVSISAPELKTKEVKVADGVWTFQNWDADSQLSKDGVKFTGTWTFAKNAGVINQIPVINAEDKTLTVGDTFDPKKDVTASDKEDGDLTAMIEVIDNTVDTSKADKYTVTYKVADKEGASVTKTITVTVKDKEEQPVAPTNPDKGDNNSNDKNNNSSNADKSDTVVETGDSTNVLLYSMVAVISLAGLITILLFKRKRSR